MGSLVGSCKRVVTREWVWLLIALCLPILPCNWFPLRAVLPLWCHLLWVPHKSRWCWCCASKLPAFWAKYTSFLYKVCSLRYFIRVVEYRLTHQPFYFLQWFEMTQYLCEVRWKTETLWCSVSLQCKVYWKTNTTRHDSWFDNTKIATEWLMGGWHQQCEPPGWRNNMYLG